MTSLLWDVVTGRPELTTAVQTATDLRPAVELALAEGSADVLQVLFDQPPERFAELDWPAMMELARSHYPPRLDLVELVQRQYNDLQLARAIRTGTREQVVAAADEGPLDGFRALLEAIDADRPEIMAQLVARGAPYDDGLGTAVHLAQRRRRLEALGFLYGLHALEAAVGGPLLLWLLRAY